MTTLDNRLAELLTLPPAQLRSAWRDTFKSPAPDIGPDLLRRGIANRLQERLHGSMTGATKREIERLRKRVERTGTRTSPGDSSAKWSLPAGEVERLVIDMIARQLVKCSFSRTDDAREMEAQIDPNRQTSIDLLAMSVSEQRELLLRYKTRVSINSETIEIEFMPPNQDQPIKLSIEAKLVNRGSEVRLAIAPDNGPIKRDPDPVLLRLIAHAFAAQDLLVRGISSPMVNHYKLRHLQQLVRLSFMAPDIISAIVDGTQPPDLTGRKIMRINKIPLDWAGQRKMFGFAAA